jgi:hypothetical protein
MAAAASSQQPPGPGVDAQGRTAIDPSENVKALTEAAVKRLDDLREMSDRCRAEIAKLRSDYDDKLRDAESKRIDAIRAVDVGAVNRAAEVAATQAATLATQVAASAETLRAQVATTATAFRAELSAALEPIQKRIDDLTRAQYEAQGQKTQVVEGRASTGAIYAFIGAALGLIGVATAVILAVTR